MTTGARFSFTFRCVVLGCAFVLAGTGGPFATASAQTVSSIYPSSAPAGQQELAVFVYGAGFAPGSSVMWNTVPLASTFVNASQLSVNIPGNLLAAPGDVLVSVSSSTNPRTNAVVFTITEPSVSSLSIVTATLPRGVAGVAYTSTLFATGGKPPYRWSISGLPPGIAFDVVTGVLSGTPALRGNHRLIVQVSDANGETSSRAFELTVNSAPLVISTSSPLFEGTVGSPYAQTFAATGGTGQYSWSLLSGSLGDLSLDAARGVITGTPRNAAALSFVVQVTDSAGMSVSKTFLINVSLPKPSITTIPALPGAKVGVAYQQGLSASGGVAPFTWSIISNSPPGIRVDSATGIISGTPTAAGSFDFTVQVTDSTGQTAAKVLTLPVAAAALALESFSQLPAAMVGQAYTFSSPATGGVGKYAWTANGVPEGLQLDGESGAISGTPTAPGSFSFTVRVTDEARATAVALWHLDVRMPALPAIVFRGVPSTLGPAAQVPIRLELEEPYNAHVAGRLVATFIPDSGFGDGTIQFSTGGRTVDFSIEPGGLQVKLPQDLAIQSGTVAGAILLSTTLESGGLNLGPQSPSWSIRVDPAPPVIKAVTTSVNNGVLEVRVTGFSTTREVSSAVFRFSATAGSTLQNSEITIPLSAITGPWFADSGNAQFGSQFTFTQPFNVQGNANAVKLESVAFANRLGSTTYQLTQ